MATLSSLHVPLSPQLNSLSLGSSSIRRISWTLSLGFVLALALISYPRQEIISGSMVPTIPVGHIVVADRLAYAVKPVSRGDIALIRPLAGYSTNEWTHRIIGLPGDTISVHNEVVTVNGQTIPHDLTSDPDATFTVPSGYYYEKGDDFEAINGLIPTSAVIGKVVIY